MGVRDNTKKDAYITDLRWDRVFLSFTVHSELNEELKFTLRRFHKITYMEDKSVTDDAAMLDLYEEIPIEPYETNGADHRFRINMACVSDRTFLENGTWQIQACMDSGKEDGFTCSISNELAYKLDDLSRVFPYGREKYSYQVTFGTYSDERQILSFYIDSRFMKENGSWKKRRYVEEALTAREKMKRVYMAAVIKMIRAYYRVAERLSKKCGRNVLFMTETKPYLWGNLKAIHDRMIERGMDKEYHISCSTRDVVGKHTGVGSWVRLVTELAKQDYVFVDDYVPILGFLDLSKRTRLIQVWHAGVGFKSVGYSRFGKSGSPFPSGSCHKKYDYAVVGSEDLIPVYEEVFGIPSEAFLPLGMARLDGFLDEERISGFKEDFYREHAQLKGKKIILFAPTFRGSTKENAYYDYQELDLGRIHEFCGDEYVWAFKMHPFVRKAPEIQEEYADRIIDLSSCENINDLYYVTDILITDYSSNYYEYALMRRPVLFFTYDREIYELTRGVHRSVKDVAPGKVCDTFDELMDALERKDYGLNKTTAFADANFAGYDGRAADRIIDMIILGKDN